MRLIDADRLCEDLLNRWSIADTRKEELIRQVMADIVTPIVVSQPTIEPQKWIPVSERFPEIGEYVLCSQDNGDVGEGILLDSGSWLICYDQSCHGSYWVNAWMPLPEPYKGEEE